MMNTAHAAEVLNQTGEGGRVVEILKLKTISNAATYHGIKCTDF